MRIAYADPPYLGQGYRYLEKREVDHEALIKRLVENYDAWALSCSTPSLRILLPMCPVRARVAAWVKPFCAFKKGVNPAYAWEAVIFVPTGRNGRGQVKTVRDWVKTNENSQYIKGLEALKDLAWWILDNERRDFGQENTEEYCLKYEETLQSILSINTTRDWVSANITLKKGLVGAKPPEFCFWLFELLGMKAEDAFDDLFPGTGIVTKSWEVWKSYQGWLNTGLRIQ